MTHNNKKCLQSGKCVCFNRFLSTFLAVVFIMTSLPVIPQVYAVNESLDSTLIIKEGSEYILNEDFSGSEWSSLIQPGNTNTDLVVDGGALKVTYDTTNNGEGTIGDLRIYFNEEQTTKMTGPTAVEFTVRKSAANKALFFTSSSGAVVSRWQTNEKLYIYENGNSTGVSLTGTEATFKMLINPDMGKQSINVNGTDYRRGTNTYNPSNVKNDTCLRFYIQDADDSFWIDDLKIYPAEVPDYEAVLWDTELIDEDCIGAQQSVVNPIGPLTLPLTGTYGSEITWSSSEENIISSTTGIINSPNEEAEVTLTATMSKGEEWDEKSFTFNFEESTTLNLIPSVDGEYIINEDFSETEFSSLIQAGNTNTDLVVDGGALKVTHDATNGGEGTVGDLRIYFDEEQTAKMTGPTAVEFTVKKSAANKALFFTSSSGAVHFRWQTNQALYIYENGTAPNNTPLAGTEATFKMLINPDMGKQSINVNGTDYKRGTDANTVANVKNETYLRLYVNSEDGFWIDNVKVYPAEVPDYEAVLWDTELLDEDELGAPQNIINPAGPLTLPLTGTYGSTITWSSSNEDIISSTTGIINNPNEEAEVTLTATVSKGSVLDEKSFIYEFGEDPNLTLTPPVDGEYIINEDFSGTEWSSLIQVGSANTDVDVDNGELKVTYARTDQGGGVGTIRIYFDESKTATLTGPTAVEFTLRKSNYNSSVFMTSDTAAVQLRWLGNQSLYIYENGSAPNNAPLTGTEATFKMLLNPDNNKQSISVNGQDRKRGTDTNNAKLATNTYLQFYVQDADDSFWIDNIKIYNTEIPDMEYTVWDTANLSYSDLTVQPNTRITLDLADLPSEGAYGSSITWSSSDTDVISDIGEVTRPTDERKIVTMTATITLGNYSQTKTFDFTVLPINESDVPPDINGEPIAEVETMSGTDLGFAFHPQLIGYSGCYAMTFDMERTGDETVSICVKDDESVALDTEINGSEFNVCTSSSLGEEPQWLMYSDDLTADEFNVTIFIDTQTGISSIWIDGIVVGEGVYVTKDLTYIDRLSIESSGSITVKNFKFYEPVLTDVLKVTLDNEYLIFKRIAHQAEQYVFEDFELPDVGPYGSTITWESTEPSFLSTDGDVTKPVSGSKNVTLTAEISSGDESQTKTIDVKVVSFNEDDLPEIKEMIFEDDVSTIEFPDKWNLTQNFSSVRRRFGEIIADNTAGDSTASATLDLAMEDTDAARNGLIGLEFILQRGNDFATVQANPWDSTSPLVVFQWEPKSIYISCKPDPDKLSETKGVTCYADGIAKVNMLFDSHRETVNVWVNNQRVIKDYYMRSEGTANLYRMVFSVNAGGMMKISDMKVYDAYFPSSDRVDKDYEWLEFDRICNEPVMYGASVVNSDLNLMTKGLYGSDIEWSSSEPDIISANGTFNPGACTSLNNQITLTARITCGDNEKTKELQVVAVGQNADSASIVNGDYDLITEENISLENSNRIMMSLNFMDTGVNGSHITWKSSNTRFITHSGRVLRPSADNGDTEVTVIATISHGDVVREKTLNYTVLAQSSFVDPQHMPDTEFFGEWDSSLNRWITEGKLDYTYSDDLKEVEAAVKQGDYNLADEKLLTAMRNRKPKSTYLGTRDINWSNVLADGIQYLQSSPYTAEFIAGGEWETISVKLPTSCVVAGGISTVSLMAWYNEVSELLIASREHPNEAFRPKLQFRLNGQLVTYDASADATVRAGDYVHSNYGNEQYLKVKTFGELMSNETYKSFIQFDTSDLLQDSVVSDVKLILYCAASPAFSDGKRILITNKESMNVAEDVFTWASISGYVYNYNGLPGGYDWDGPAYSNVEFVLQASRMQYLLPLALEYKATTDELWANIALSSIEDFINDRGGWTYSNGLRGAFTRIIDGGARVEVMAKSYDTLKTSSYMTPELNTAILKLVYDEINQQHLDKTATNNMAAMKGSTIDIVSTVFPEFKENSKWLDAVNVFFEDYISSITEEDGAYIEHCTGYNGVISYFTQYKKGADEAGRGTNPLFNERIHNWAYYNMLAYFPNGRSLMYGDNGDGFRGSIDTNVDYLANALQDTDLEYLATSGSRGTVPDWTSRLFPTAKVAFMRANWTTDSPYMFTQVRGPGSHGCADNTHVSVYAYGRVLLPDAGIFPYGSTVESIWGASEKAHNTVLINGEGQTSLEGEINHWSTYDGYDFLSETALGYQGAKHTRNIMFVKPNMWIVSDVVRPNNSEYLMGNDYKQLWHPPIDSNASITEEGYIRTNYANGANLIVASADADVETVWEEYGFYSPQVSIVQEAPYAYFQKTDVQRTATFDTVLFPYNNVSEADIDVERIDTGTATDISTAMKITTNLDGYVQTGYYYLSHESENIPVRSFGKYETDAKIVYVSEKENGTVESVIIEDGTYVLNKESGKYLIKLSEKADVIAETEGTRLIITTDNESGLEESLIMFDNIRYVDVNETSAPFKIEEGYVKPYADGGTTVVPDNNKGGLVNPDKSEEDEGSSGGLSGGSSGGSFGGGSFGGGTVSSVGFTDIIGHWAESDIKYLADRKIINGKSPTAYEPDAQITRAEFLALLERVLADETVVYDGTFKDVSVNDWYASAVQFGLNNGLISVDELFRPNDAITREEMAKMTVGAYRLKNESNVPEDYLLSYTDVGKDTHWSYEYVCVADYLGLIKGVGNGLFVPGANATRAQSAVIIKRLLNAVE